MQPGHRVPPWPRLLRLLAEVGIASFGHHVLEPTGDRPTKLFELLVAERRKEPLVRAPEGLANGAGLDATGGIVGAETFERDRAGLGNLPGDLERLADDEKQ